MNISNLILGLNSISDEVGIIKNLINVPRMNQDPVMINYGVEPVNISFLSNEKYIGNGAGSSFEWESALLAALGETYERYAATFYNLDESITNSYNHLNRNAVNPQEYALFHEEQYANQEFRFNKFNKDIELTWFPTTDLTNGEETWLPGQFIFLPFSQDKNVITISSSTGLAAHTNYYKAILNGLYEVIERDSFTITWLQNLVPEKIKLSTEIRSYIDLYFPTKYEWHFFDINYDLGVPSILGFCFGEAEFGSFVAVGAATRATYAEAVRKTIQEIGQGVFYFRYLLNEKKRWNLSNNFGQIKDFDEHAIFYTQRTELWHVFDKWIKAPETKSINFFEKNNRGDKEEIKYIIQLMKDKKYNVLFKDITTCDLRQIGFYSIKIFIPQLIPLSGIYSAYFLGGKRLYSIPSKMGYKQNDFHNLNKYPHPFP